MKNCLSLIVLLVLLCAIPLHAQKPIVQELPELQEWYSWDGATNATISYLPNFKKNGGENAVAQGRTNSPTWFNRFAYDTVNQFSWKDNGANYIVRGDFNGDGVTDYWTAFDRVHRGIANGEFPNVEPDTNYFLDKDNGYKFVFDLNKDGYDDMLQEWYSIGCSSCALFRIIFGGKDLKHMQQRIIGTSSSFRKVVSIYQNENGEPRIIAYQNSDFAEGFYLYEITFSGSPSDSIIVGLKELDKIEEKKQTKNQWIFEPNFMSFYQSKVEKSYSLMIVRANPLLSQGYAIEQDKFRFVKNTIGMDQNGALSGSIDGDLIEDYAYLTLVKVNNEEKLGYNIYSGNPLKDTIVRAYFILPVKNYQGSVAYIGDVTGDGIGDIAFGALGQFIVYKGVNWRKLSVDDLVTKTDFTLRQAEPNPIGAEGKAVLPATIARSGKYTLELFNLTGKRLGVLFSGDLPSGDTRIPFDVKSLNIPSGMYTLRLSDGKRTQERAFIFHP